MKILKELYAIFLCPFGFHSYEYKYEPVTENTTNITKICKFCGDSETWGETTLTVT